MNMPLLFELGEMIVRSKEVGECADPDETKPKIVKYIEDIAAGRPGEDLTREENDAWSEMDRRQLNPDWLPSTIADTVGLRRRTTFADLCLVALHWTRKRQAGELTGSASENAYLAAES
jgi:hypothetical protein